MKETGHMGIHAAFFPPNAGVHFSHQRSSSSGKKATKDNNSRNFIQRMDGDTGDLPDIWGNDASKSTGKETVVCI